MELFDGNWTPVEREGPQSVRHATHPRQMTAALGEAHDAGLVHRDSRNVMLCKRGGVPDFEKVLDFDW
jgi:hypothetical protein